MQSMPRAEEGDETSASRQAVVTAISSICNGKNLKAAARAASALGFIAHGDRSKALLESVAQALLKLSSKKGDELQFAVGEGLCFSFGGMLLRCLAHFPS